VFAPSRLREKRRTSDDGFTLIELLVVVVIIGVLIAIAIPLYLNYRKGAENKSAASDLRNSIAVIEQCYGDGAVYPTAINSTATTITGCASTGATIKLSSATAMTYIPNSTTTATAYNVWTTHGTNGTYYCYASSVGGSVKEESAAPSGTYLATCP
jgi:type IV pilus assembly protein PilA